MAVPRQSSSAFLGSLRYAQSMASPQMPMLTLAHPARPMPRPAAKGFLRMNSKPPTANITDRAPRGAPGAPAQRRAPAAEAGGEGLLPHEQQAADGEHHRQGLVVRTGHHRPDQHRVGDG